MLGAQMTPHRTQVHPNRTRQLINNTHKSPATTKCEASLNKNAMHSLHVYNNKNTQQQPRYDGTTAASRVSTLHD